MQRSELEHIIRASGKVEGDDVHGSTVNMKNKMNHHKVAVAPMMDWTDRHCRYFLRLLSPSAMLYTEMITAAALKFGDASRLLDFSDEEHPVALQLGGSEPDLMADAAKWGAAHGYDEININVGCPSDRVQSGQFGACLMLRPETVAACVLAMRSRVDVPVTVKTRIGIDDNDSYDFLHRFVDSVVNAGCEEIVVHARIAVLGGLSPKENRSVPPLNYERVYRLKQDFPQLFITVNGGITSIEQAEEHLRHADAVMIGREAYHNPWFLVELERALGGAPSGLPGSRIQVVQQMFPYIEAQLADGIALKNITRHMLGLFAAQPGARNWRRSLSEASHRPGAGIDVLQTALQQVPEAA